MRTQLFVEERRFKEYVYVQRYFYNLNMYVFIFIYIFKLVVSGGEDVLTVQDYVN